MGISRPKKYTRGRTETGNRNENALATDNEPKKLTPRRTTTTTEYASRDNRTIKPYRTQQIKREYTATDIVFG